MNDTPNSRPDFRPEFKTLDASVVAALPKVVLFSQQPIASLADDNVVYAEVIVEPSALEGVMDQAVAAPSTVAIVLRCHETADVEIVANDATGLLVGAITDSADVAAFARERFVACVLESSLEEQLAVASPRIVRPLSLFDDIRIDSEGEIELGARAAWVRDRQLQVVCDPIAAVANGHIDELADYPLELLRSLGFKAVCAGLDTSLLLELSTHLEFGIEEIYELTFDALEGSFLPDPLRRRLVSEQLLPAFEAFSGNDDAPTTAPEPEPESLSDEDLAGIDPLLLEQLGIDPRDFQPRASSPADEDKSHR